MSPATELLHAPPDILRAAARGVAGGPPHRREVGILTFVNLTPHKLNVLKEDGSYMPLPPSGTVARVATKRTKALMEDGVAVCDIQFGEVEGIPEPAPDTLCVVPTIVLAALKHHPTAARCYAHGKLIRNREVTPVSCIGLGQ